MTSLPIGIHPRHPEAWYHGLDYASQSSLKLLAAGDSPKQVRWQMQHPKPTTPAMALGKALHCLVFEPQEFEDRVVLCPPFNKRKKDERENYNAFIANRAQKTVIEGVEQWDALHAMAGELVDHPFCRTFLPAITQRELTCIWRHPVHGLTVKARLDAVVAGDRSVLDIKTCRSVNPHFLEREIRIRGYLHQGGFYTYVGSELGIDVRHYVLLWVQNVPPYEVVPARLTETTLAIGRRELERPMEIMAECYRTGRWPGTTDTLIDLSLAEWDERRSTRDWNLTDYEEA